MESPKSAAFTHARAGRRLQDELLLDILDHAPDAIAIMEFPSPARSEPFFNYINRAFELMYLCRREETVGLNVTEFMAARSFPQDVQHTLKLLAEGKPFTTSRVFDRSDGRTVWLEVNFRPIAMENQPVRWIFVARDMTVKKTLEDRAIQLGTAVEEGNDLVTISVADERIYGWRFAYVNEAFTRTTGYRPDDIIGRTFVSIIPDGTPAAQFTAIRDDLFAGKSVRDEIRFVNKDGLIGTYIASMKPIADPVTGKFTSIVSILRDVTEERRQEERLQYEAEHDALTGLHNRRYLERMLHDSVAIRVPDSPEHALIFIDLDGFKDVNDTLGHAAGDEVLRLAARAFNKCLSGTDLMVRYGGDEFAAVLFHCRIENAERIAQTMIECWRAARSPWTVTASIGVAAVSPGESPEAAVKRADEACYRAKALGGDRVVAVPLPPATFPT